MDNNRTTGSVSNAAPDRQIDFKTLLDLSDEAVLLLDLDGRPIFVSPACERIFGWTASRITEARGELVQLSGDERESGQLKRILDGKFNSSESLPQGEMQVKSASGNLIWVEARTHFLRSPKGAPYAVALYLRDITRQKELEGLLEAANQTDPQTGLLNGRAFEEILKREWAISLREKTHTSLIKVSLDRFDALTEKLNPGMATDYLVKVSRTLAQTARRPADIAARTGKSEFTLLLPRTHELGAATIGEYLLVAIQDLAIPDPENSAGNGIMTASIGATCTIADQNGITVGADFILSCAQTCVDEARNSGGNTVKTVVKHLER